MSLLIAMALAAILAAGGAPRAQIHFPPPQSLTDAAAIHVTGSAQDDDGVSSIRVNGVDAVSTDGFAHWSAEVPLAAGWQTLTVASRDALGNSNLDAAQVSIRDVGAVLLHIDCITSDPTTNHLLILEGSPSRLIDVDLQAQTRRIVSSPTIGDGRQLGTAWGVAMLEPGKSALVVNDSAELLRVDLQTGDRLVLSSFTVGAGTKWTNPTDVAVARASGIVYVLASIWPSGVAALFAVEPLTGTRKIISSGHVGSGPPLVAPRGLACDEASGRVLCFDRNSSSLISIDLVTGARTIVSDASTGTGPTIDQCSTLVYDAASATAFELDEYTGAVLSVDVQNGNRTQLAAPTDNFQLLNGNRGFGLAADVAGTTVYRAEASDVQAIDRAIGQISTVVDNVQGDGPHLWFVEPLSRDATTARAYAFGTDRSLHDLYEFDPSDGTRHLIAATQFYPQFQNVAGPVCDPSHDRLLFATHSQGSDFAEVAAFDLTSGAFSFVTAPVHMPDGSGPIAANAAGSRAFLANWRSIWTCDLSTGRARVLDDARTGSGPRLSSISTVACDAAGDTVFAAGWSPNGGAVLAIDVASGVRQYVAGEDVGTGPKVSAPVALSVDDLRKRIVVADAGSSALIAIDELTLTRTYASKSSLSATAPPKQSNAPDAPVGRGPDFSFMSGGVVDAQLNVAFTTSILGVNGILCIDLESGDRVIVSR